MATVAAYRFAPEVFALGRVFKRYPDATIRIERVIPTGTAICPYFWVEGIPDAEIHSVLDGTTGIDGVELVDAFEDRSLLRCHCATAHSELFEVLAGCDVSLLGAEGTDEGWTLTLRGDEKRALTKFDRASRAAGFTPELCELHDVAAVPAMDDSFLTDRQREAIQLAYRRGYYEEPRDATLADVAGDLCISRQALASRLRRGHRALIRAYVIGSDI